MGLRLGIAKEGTIYKGTGRLRPGRRHWVRGGEERWSTVEPASPFPRAVVRGAIHLLRPPGLEGTYQLPGKGTLPIPIPSTFTRPP